MPSFRRALSAALIAAFLVLVPAASGQSQATTGVIEGTVTDESGAVLPGVTVTLTNTATGYERTLVTDAEGRFRAVLMPLGPYKITAALEGFATLVREGLELSVGQTISVRPVLQVAATEESILVTAEASVIETSRTESQVRIDEEAIEGLPNNGRNFLDFSTLTPGVTIVQGPDGDELSISGQRGVSNNISVDGADFNNPFFGEQRGGQRPAFTFNIDAIQEVLIVPDGAPAEFGRSSGGFVSVITKSGTNDLQGTAHVFFQNDDLSAQAKNRDGSRQPSFSLERLQTGFTLGGPLRRDKTFYFLAYDRQDGEQTKQTDPSRIEPRVVEFFESIGVPNENGPIDRTDDADVLLAKVDYRSSNKNLWTFRYSYTWSEQVNGTFDVDSWGRSANAIEKDYSHAGTVSLISTLSDSLLNEFRGQYAKEWRPRPYDGPRPAITGGRPLPDTAFDFGNGYRFGMPFFIPVEYDDDRIQLTDNLSILRGRHSIKAGVEYNEVASSQTFIGFANGRFIFGSTEGFLNYARNPNYVECLDGSTSQVGFCPDVNGDGVPDITGPVLLYLQQAGVGGRTVEEAGTQTIRQKEPAVFIQDTWQPNANLTVDYGLRWEAELQPDVQTPPDEVFFAPFIGQTVTNEFGSFEFPSDGTIPDDDAMFQPRLGIAWTPPGSSNSVVRFSAGYYAARIPALMLASTRSTNGSIGQTLFRNSALIPILGPPPPWPGLIPADQVSDPFFPEVFVFDKDFENPKTLSTALSWEREIYPELALLLKVNYSKTDHLFRMFNANDPVFGCPWSSGLPPAGINGISCDAGSGLHVVESTAKSRYLGATIGFNKRWSDNYAFQLYYTNSKDESDDDNERDPFTYRYASAANLAPEFGLSDRHQRHRLNFWMLYNAPYGIDVNVRYSYRSAQPLSITASGEPAATPQDRINPDGSITQRNLGKKDNKFSSLDVRLAKDFQVGDITLQPVIDVFNVLDADNFLLPQVTNLIFNFDGTVQSGAGQPRQVQVGLRVVF